MMPFSLSPGIGTSAQILADLNAQVAVLQAGPQSPDVTAKIAALQALAAKLQ